jgi:Tol biopolymer transport system component
VRGPGKHEIVVRAVGGDDVRIFKSDKQRSPIGWTPDSRAVILNAQLDEREFGAVRLDLATGKSTVLNIARNPGRSGLVSADGREVYTVAWTEAGGTGILALDLNDGSERLIATIESPGSLSLSPDGQTFAVLDRSTARIYTLPIAGGDPNIIFEIEGDITQSRLSAEAMAGRPEWTPDGKHILFIKDGSIMRVPVSGGLAEKVVDIPEGRRIHFRLHPDGSRFLINAGLDKGEIWMVKGLPGMPVGSGTSDR